MIDRRGILGRIADAPGRLRAWLRRLRNAETEADVRAALARRGIRDFKPVKRFPLP